MKRKIIIEDVPKQNAKHFNHEYGGIADSDNNQDMMKYGGNPFHPLKKYMQDGGGAVPADKNKPQGDPDQAFADTGIQQQPQPPQKYGDNGVVPPVTSPAENTGLGTPMDNSGWQQGLTPEQQQQVLQAHTTPPGTYAPQSTPTKKQFAVNFAAPVAIADYVTNNKRNNAANAFNRIQERTDIKYGPQEGSKGDYTTNSNYYKPNQTIFNSGYYPTGHAQMGGEQNPQQGQQSNIPDLQEGQTYDLNPQQIKQLMQMGYEFESVKSNKKR